MDIQYNEYMQFLHEVLKTHSVIVTVISVIFVPIIILFIWKLKEIGLKLLFGLVLGMFVGAGIWGVVPYQMDISQNAIETYSGEYSSGAVEYVTRSDPKIEVTFDDGKKESFRLTYSMDNIIENTTRKGTLVYSKYSKILFYME